jgi:hypothetical protein
MPPARTDRLSVLTWPLVILLCLLWICILAVIWPILVLEQFFVHRPQMRRLALGRSGEHIGSFARAFNRRREPFDPWVIRATWEALGPYVRLEGKQIPMRPTDRLIQDLSIDPEDRDACTMRRIPQWQRVVLGGDDAARDSRDRQHIW